jgi:transposase
MQTEIENVGIDVASKSLSVCLTFPNGEKVSRVIKNEKKSILNFSRSIVNLKGRIVLESTGRHHILASYLLSQKGLNVSVINPLITKRYSQSKIRKVKTDKVDAEVLAEIAEKEDLRPFLSEKEDLGFKKKMSLIASLDKQIQKLKAMLREYSEFNKILEIPSIDADKSLKEAIDNLEKQKKKLEKHIERKGNQEETRILSSIPGVSNYLASIATNFFSSSFNRSSRQWIAYTGMDISVSESGNWKGKCKLTKRGNPYLRKRLYCAAWGAVMTNPDFNKYYYQLKQEKGRKHSEALVITARKLLRIMFTLLKSNTLFDSKKCFNF